MAYTPASINSMMASIQNEGVLFSNRFEVIFTPPKIIEYSPAFRGMPNLTLRCESVLVPGRSFNVTPYRIYGPARNMPTEAIYSGEISMTFLLSADLREREFFETWMNSISNPIDYKFEYYYSYISNVQVNILNRNDDISHISMIEEVYPKTIGDLQMGYDRDNDTIKQEITFAFRRYIPDYNTPRVQSAISALSGFQVNLNRVIGQ